MCQKEIHNQEYLEAGRKVFVDYKEYNDSVNIASYCLLKKIVPANQLKTNCASIFGLHVAQLNLSGLHQQIISNLFYMSLSYAETARRVNLSSSQVTRHENKAVWQLRKFSKEFLV